MRQAKIHVGAALEVLRELPAESVQCVVTSPPYWGLRDYGMDGQAGLEPTLEEFLSSMVAVFDEVRRVLRSDGTCWLNMGDSYANNPPGNDDRNGSMNRRQRDQPTTRPRRPLPAKNLIGQPWRLAFALQAAGWWLRSDIIWHKPNAMPESAADRPGKAHEYVFLLTKSARYFYDQDATRVAATGRAPGNVTPSPSLTDDPIRHRTKAGLADIAPAETRKSRTVWTIPAAGFPGAHFATFPIDLPARCIGSGTSSAGACAECGAPLARVTEQGEPDERRRRACGADATGGYEGRPRKNYAAARAQNPAETKARILAGMRERITTGWQLTCACNPADEPVPCTVLDPFSGAGTTGLAALRLGREYIGIELNPDYAEMSRQRLADDAPLFNTVTVHTTPPPGA